MANEGVEQIELTDPWKTVEDAGGRPVLVAPESGSVQAYDHLDKADTFDDDRTTNELSLDDIDGVVLPGGVANPDRLRMDDSAVKFLSDFVGAGKPVAVICHGPWTLVEAGVVEGRTLTSWPSLETDIRNAGGTWVDEEVCRDGNLVSSRKPDDLPAFCDAMVEVFGSAQDGRRVPADPCCGAGRAEPEIACRTASVGVGSARTALASMADVAATRQAISYRVRRSGPGRRHDPARSTGSRETMSGSRTTATGGDVRHARCSALAFRGRIGTTPHVL